MMNKISMLAIGLLLLQLIAAQPAPADREATPEARYLFTRLQQLMKRGYLVGHQDDLAYGVHWKYEPGRSDVREVTGDYPGIYGWELGNLELGHAQNLDGVPFDRMRSYIQDGYRRGALITISWHLNNPLTGKNAWDAAPGSVAAVLPGHEKHELFKSYLDKVAAFLAAVRDDQGRPIPLLWRPFHEHTGGWFWWGVKSGSDEEFRELFRFSVDYLRQEKGLHQLLIGYNTGTEFQNETELLARYPGDDYVDIISFDTYQRGGGVYDSAFVRQLDQCLGVVSRIATKRGKIPAVGEIGFNGIPYTQWFIKVLAPVFDRHKFSYVLFWRNAGYKPHSKETEFYLPYKGHSSAPDFKKFYQLKNTLFEKEACRFGLYRKK
ncbi:glycosyl hydrolase [Niabella terrae]